MRCVPRSSGDIHAPQPARHVTTDGACASCLLGAAAAARAATRASDSGGCFGARRRRAGCAHSRSACVRLSERHALTTGLMKGDSSTEVTHVGLVSILAWHKGRRNRRSFAWCKAGALVVLCCTHMAGLAGPSCPPKTVVRSYPNLVRRWYGRQRAAAQCSTRMWAALLAQAALQACGLCCCRRSSAGAGSPAFSTPAAHPGWYSPALHTWLCFHAR